VNECVHLRCSVLQCVAVCHLRSLRGGYLSYAPCIVRSLLWMSSVLVGHFCPRVCCSVLQCVAVCCNVLQCVVVCLDCKDLFENEPEP